MDKQKIAILSTVANFDLYKKSSLLFPANIQKYVIDGTNGMHGIHSILYMIKKLKGRGIEWLIMADEDVIFTDSSPVFDIIDKMKAEKISVCGIRDGGEIVHRKQNPYVINTFFSILNFKELESIWNKNEMLKHQFVNENEFDDDLSNLKYDFDTQSCYEPYYCFYFWLRRKGKKILFLDSKMDNDQISNYVFYNNKEILCHTWYARTYGENDKHTKRINAILESKKNTSNYQVFDKKKVIFFKKSTFKIKQKILKNYRKILSKFFSKN